MKPFLRWVGSKAWVAEQLAQEILFVAPKQYHEPFLGSGAVLLRVAESGTPCFGSDLNAPLINLWVWIQRDAAAVCRAAARLADQFGDDQNGYNTVRQRFNATPRHTSLADAAAVLYLNTTCFNGIWRENAKGEFNVPYGKRSAKKFLATDLSAVASRLRVAEFSACNFTDALTRVSPGDAVFCDPPYAPTSSEFEDYVAGGFGAELQRNLAADLQRLAERGVAVWATNSDTPLIREIYAWADVDTLREPRRVAANGNRNAAPCVIIRGGPPWNGGL